MSDRRALGRYNSDSTANDPGDLPAEGTRRKSARVHSQAEISYGVVPEPNSTLRGQRQKVAINIRVDVLETEYKRDRISVAGYLSMLEYQQMLERLAGGSVGGGQWMQGSRIDPTLAIHLKMVRLIDNAEEAIKVQRDVIGVFGQVGCAIVRAALMERVDFSDIARRLCGRANAAEVYFVAKTFRLCCEGLADHWKAEGARKRTPRDEYTELAEKHRNAP